MPPRGRLSGSGARKRGRGTKGGELERGERGKERRGDTGERESATLAHGTGIIKKGARELHERKEARPAPQAWRGRALACADGGLNGIT